jgi:hypothetical protein
MVSEVYEKQTQAPMDEARLPASNEEAITIYARGYTVA